MSAPYVSQMFPSSQPELLGEWARTGFRRSLANYPHFIDARAGDIVVTEHDSHKVQMFDKYVNECRFNPFGERGTGKNQFINPTGVATTCIPGAQIVVADSGNKRICFIGITTTQHGYGNLNVTFSFGQQDLECPQGIDYDMNRNVLIVTDQAKRRVTMHDMSRGTILGAVSSVANLIGPVDVAVDSASRIFVSDARSDRICVFDRNGDFLFDFGMGILNNPWGLCFDKDSNLIVADEGNNRILMFSSAGQLLKEIATGIISPKGVSITIHDNLVVATGDPYGFIKVIKFK